MTELTLINEYNIIVDKCQKQTANSNEEILTGLSNHELEIFIAGKTLQYGRNFSDSMRNAKNHLMDRHRAIKVFSTADKEKYFGTI